MRIGCWLEWTSSHQCTSWGWGRWSCFGDEPKAHPPYPKLLFFFHLFFAPKIFPPTYLPPTSHSIATAWELLEWEQEQSQSPRVVGAGAGTEPEPGSCWSGNKARVGARVELAGSSRTFEVGPTRDPEQELEGKLPPLSLLVLSFLVVPPPPPLLFLL
jgi:hypothetical protein